MRTSSRVLTALAALTVLAACGGGGTTAAAVDPLNSFESSLVGRYTLAGFKLYAQGDQIYWPENFASSYGEMVLNADRTGSIAVSLEGCTGGPDRVCGDAITWRADSGLLRLTCESGDQPEHVAEWTDLGHGSLSTYFFLPTHTTDYDLFLVDAGYERLDWSLTP